MLMLFQEECTMLHTQPRAGQFFQLHWQLSTRLLFKHAAGQKWLCVHTEVFSEEFCGFSGKSEHPRALWCPVTLQASRYDIIISSANCT